MSTRQGGYGRELYGDPFGGGGPLTIVRARAIGSQLVRVTFSEEPVHTSGSGQFDALNPANYLLSVDAGQATDPVAVGVEARMVTGPAMGVGNGSGAGVADERGFDVHVDRALVLGITYRITAHAIMSLTGGTMGAPYSASFPGVVRLVVTKQPPRKVDLTDIQNDPFTGGFVVDDSGDLQPESNQTGLRKRMLRRAYTPKNAFAHLRGYGIGLPLKKGFSPAQLQAIKVDLRAQLMQEPEILDADVRITQQAGVTTFLMIAQTRKGAVQAGVAISPSGAVVIS
jgi:hypothetical protein